MNPFLRTGKQFLMVGLLWSPICFSVIYLSVSLLNISWAVASIWTLPPMLLVFVMSISTWYFCRITVIYQWRLLKRIIVHLVVAVILTALWLLLIYFYSQVLDTIFKASNWTPLYFDALPLFTAINLTSYFAAALIHYLVLVVEQNRLAEKEVMNQAILKGEAELRALKATVHPHFLFNALNILGPLMRISSDQAQTVVARLSDFLVYSLQYGKLSKLL
jgi:two-component system, LytTR family, sensor kinase